MKINGNAIRPGNLIEHKGGLWRAIKTQHVKPGKGAAFLQVELKEIRQGTKLNERFRSSETVERVSLEQKEFQFLFSDGDDFTFMDQESFEQVTVNVDMVGEDQAKFLQDGMQVQIESYEENPIGIALPSSVVVEVTEADAVIKGQTASSSYKPAMVEGGIRVMVPPYVETGIKIVVNTEDATFVERFKN